MYRRILCFFLLALLTGAVLAKPVLLGATDGLHSPIKLAGHLAVLCVADAEENIERIAAPERAAEFINLPAMLVKGYTRDTCWLRLTLQRAQGAPAEWLLEAGLPYLDDLTLFLPRPQGEAFAQPGKPFQSWQLGDRTPYTARPIPHRLFVFPLSLPEDAPQTAYLRIRTSSSMMLDTLNVWQYPGLLAASQSENAFYWFVFGMIALGALSNLVFWFWLRERIYRSYSLYLLALLVLNLSNSGFATQWLLSEQPSVADRAIGFVTSLIFFMGLTFFNEVFHLRENFPRLGRFIPLALGFYLVSMLASALGFYGAIAPFLQLVALFVTLGISLAGPWLLWRGMKGIQLYVIAFGTQIFIAIVAMLRNIGLWPMDTSLDFFILAATAIHVILLNFALAERVRRVQREKLATEQFAARLDAEQMTLNQHREFLSMVAHEFRTPLAIIDTSAQRIEGTSATDRDKIIERCGNIRAAAQRMTLLMDEFMTIDRMDGALRSFAPSPINSKDLILAVTSAHEGEGKVVVQCLNLPLELTGDSALLQLALSNLISNALRHGVPDQPVFFSAIGTDSGGVDFLVRDSGPGIAADELPRLFDKYFRGRAAKTKPGAGLGLYLVHRIAELHGGFVKVESTVGQGSLFVLHLP